MTLKRLPNRTYPALGISITHRAVKESFAKRCSTQELQEIRKYFEQSNRLKCVYCGAEHPTRWDHFFPISQGGDTVKGNLVPACGSCDDSKQDKTLDEWFSSKSKKKPSEDRHDSIKKTITDYQAHFGYTPQAFEKKLSADQRATYEGFLEKLDKLRNYLREQQIIN